MGNKDVNVWEKKGFKVKKMRWKKGEDTSLIGMRSLGKEREHYVEMNFFRGDLQVN